MRSLSPLTHQQIGKFIVALLVLTVPLLLHYRRNAMPGLLSQAGYETLQAARYLATNRKLGTEVIRPLEARYIKANADGTITDLRHGPLHLAVTAAAIKALRETKSGRGDRAAVLLHLTLALLGALLTAWLARRMFGEWGGPEHAIRSAFFFAFGGTAMALALEPQPALLAALFAALNAYALFRLDGERDFRQMLLWACLSGALWGLTFLTLYSALVFLPLLAIYVAWVSPRRWVALGAFLITAALVALPVPILAMRATGNPLFHGRLMELVMYTSTYPGDSLYSLNAMPRSLPAYLADGGYKEVLRKLGTNLVEYLPQTLALLGPFVAMFTLGSGLIRFTDPRINRQRTLAFALLGAHILGLALFFPASIGIPALFVHVPLIAVLASAFLEIVVRSRRMLPFHTQVALLGWSALACIPGVTHYLVGAPQRSMAPELFDWLAGGDPGMKRYQATKRGVLASDIPAEIAFRFDAPCAYLPADTMEIDQFTERINKPIAGFLVSGALADQPVERDTILEGWREAQQKIGGYWSVLLDTPRMERVAFTNQYPMQYPAVLRGALTLYQPLPIPEQGSGRYSLVFWYNGPSHERTQPE
ncbi:MAG: hypothetical protein QM758_16150 [Armatimonas sp.]